MTVGSPGSKAGRVWVSTVGIQATSLEFSMPALPPFSVDPVPLSGEAFSGSADSCLLLVSLSAAGGLGSESTTGLNTVVFGTDVVHITDILEAVLLSDESEFDLSLESELICGSGRPFSSGLVAGCCCSRFGLWPFSSWPIAACGWAPIWAEA